MKTISLLLFFSATSAFAQTLNLDKAPLLDAPGPGYRSPVQEPTRTPIQIKDIPAAPLFLEVRATFDGYYDRPTTGYTTTFPIIRPTERYGFINVQKVISSNWSGASDGGLSLALGSADLKTKSGSKLIVGRQYYFFFKLKPLDAEQTYELLVLEN